LAAGPARSEQYPYRFIQIFSNGFELIRLKDELPLLENFQIKYRIVENQIRNDFTYWNFSIFEIEFELKIKEA
jgi:hypothetical protein